MVSKGRDLQLFRMVESVQVGDSRRIIANHAEAWAPFRNSARCDVMAPWYVSWSGTYKVSEHSYTAAATRGAQMARDLGNG